MKATRPLASISLDLDDLWTYLRTRGDTQWQEYPSYLPAFMPLALDMFERLNLRLTFFIVGADAARKVNLPYLHSIAERGHEIGNHSFSHDCSLPRYTARSP